MPSASMEISLFFDLLELFLERSGQHRIVRKMRDEAQRRINATADLGETTYTLHYPTESMLVAMADSIKTRHPVDLSHLREYFQDNPDIKILGETTASDGKTKITEFSLNNLVNKYDGKTVKPDELAAVLDELSPGYDRDLQRGLSAYCYLSKKERKKHSVIDCVREAQSDNEKDDEVLKDRLTSEKKELEYQKKVYQNYCSEKKAQLDILEKNVHTTEDSERIKETRRLLSQVDKKYYDLTEDIKSHQEDLDRVEKRINARVAAKQTMVNAKGTAFDMSRESVQTLGASNYLLAVSANTKQTIEKTKFELASAITAQCGISHIYAKSKRVIGYLCGHTLNDPTIGDTEKARLSRNDFNAACRAVKQIEKVEREGKLSNKHANELKQLDDDFKKTIEQINAKMESLEKNGIPKDMKYKDILDVEEIEDIGDRIRGLEKTLNYEIKSEELQPKKAEEMRAYVSEVGLPEPIPVEQAENADQVSLRVEALIREKKLNEAVAVADGYANRLVTEEITSEAVSNESPYMEVYSYTDDVSKAFGDKGSMNSDNEETRVKTLAKVLVFGAYLEHFHKEAMTGEKSIVENMAQKAGKPIDVDIEKKCINLAKSARQSTKQKVQEKVIQRD